jgi:hypothetical protein
LSTAFDSFKPFQHSDTGDVDDETLERDARTHLARSPRLQVVAELLAKLRTCGFSWWSATFTRSQWRPLPRMQWLVQRPDIRQRITSSLTGLPPKAARSKAPEFQAGLIDTVLDHGDISGATFEEAFSPQDLVIYGPVPEMWEKFRQRMPWGDETEAHRKLVGWLLGVLLSERSTLDPEMLRRPILSAWDVRTAIDTRVWQDCVPIEVRAAVDEARLKREKLRPRESYSARHELQIATPDVLAEHIPLADLLPVLQVAEQALFAPPGDLTATADSGTFHVAPPPPRSANGLPGPIHATSSSGIVSVPSTRPYALVR